MSSAKFTILLVQVSTLLGNKPGKAFAVKINKVSTNNPAPRMIPIYFNGYPPKNTNTITIVKMMAVVEKLAGKISINTRKTGNHNGKIVSLKVTVFSTIFVK